jgi:putative tryptophan/tyrosine transport system substrate-binding protein
MRRRQLELGLAGFGSLLVSPVGRLLAQEALPKVAFLSPTTRPETEDPAFTQNNLLKRLRELGYVDGQNVSFEFRFANHALERLPALAGELAAIKPDVLWTFTSGGARAAAAASSTIPIVVAPVNEGTMASFVSDFAQPAGNVTGLTLNSRDQHEKCLQLLKEAAPSTDRVGVLINPANPVWQDYPDALQGAGRALGLALVRLEARGLSELDQAFEMIDAQGIDAVFVLNDSTLVGVPALERILELTVRFHLPSICDDVEFPRDGGLLGLGPDYSAIGRGAAEYIHRILQGAKVSELPVVLPTTFVLTVNLVTAAQLGIEIPPSILLRADEVIE